MKNLDDETMGLTVEEDVDHINSEEDSWSKQTEDITEVLVKIANLLSKQRSTENLLSPSHSDISSIGSQNPVSINNINDNVKVSKLVINKFDGRFLHFISFWDQFKAAIHSNAKLNNIDTFKGYVCYIFASLFFKSKREHLSK